MKKAFLWLIFLMASVTTFSQTFASQTFATLDPSKKCSTGNLYDGNLRFVWGAGTFECSVISNISVTSGKWYWEYTIYSPISWDFAVWGISRDVTGYDLIMWEDAGSWGMYYWPDFLSTVQSKYHSDVHSAYWSGTMTDGVVIGIAYDADNHTLGFYKNGVYQWLAFTGITSGTMYAGASVESENDFMIANFGATSFTYTPPAGFNAGLYTGTPDTGSTTSQMQDTVNKFGSGAINSSISTASGPVGNIVYVLLGITLFFIIAGIIIYALKRFKSTK